MAVRTGSYGHFQRLRDSSFSVFVDNIPGDKDARWLWNLFGSDGEILDAFIPSKERRVTRTRFGFVRFKVLEEAKAAICKWNGSVCGKVKIQVMLADFGGKLRSRKVEVLSSLQGRVSGHGKRPWFVEEDGKVRSWGGLNGADIVKRRKVPLEVLPENEEWIQRSAVAVLKDLIPSCQLEGELKLDGVKFHKLFPLGGNKMLIHFNSLVELESCLSKNHSSISRRFSNLQKWKEEDSPKRRSAWLSILGLPFKAWSEENFQKIVEPFGRYLKMEKYDLQETGLERVRVLVELFRLGSISEVFDAVVGNKTVEVTICEECFFNGRETDWKVEECAVEGEEDKSRCSISRGVSRSLRHPCSGDQGGGGDGNSDGEKSLAFFSSDGEKSDNSRLLAQGAVESLHKVSESVLEEEETSLSSRSRSVGKKSGIFDFPDCSWGSTLQAFLKQKGERRMRKGSKDGQSKQQGLEEEDVSRVEASFGSNENSERSALREGRLKAECKASIPVVTFGKARSASKVVKRKVSKEKRISKGQRNKKKADLERLKKSYVDVLDKSIKTNRSIGDQERREAEWRMEAEGPPQKLDEKVSDAEELERRIKQRKEAEETYRFAWSLGIKGSLPEEGMIQLFVNQLEEKYMERMKGK